MPESNKKATPAETRDAAIKVAKAQRKESKEQVETTYEHAVAAAWAKFTAETLD